MTPFCVIYIEVYITAQQDRGVGLGGQDKMSRSFATILILFSIIITLFLVVF